MTRPEPLRIVWRLLLGCILAGTSTAPDFSSARCLADETAEAGEAVATNEPAASLFASPHVPEDVRLAIQAGEYDRAVTRIDGYLSKDADSQPKDIDYLAALRGRVLILAEKFDEGVKSLEDFEKRFPQSRHLTRARLERAVALVALKRFDQAELIYRAQAERLLSDERRAEMADICLQYADRYFEMTDEQLRERFDTQDDEARYFNALPFYEMALLIGPANDMKLAVEMRAAQCQEKIGRTDAMVKRYRRLLQEYPDSEHRDYSIASTAAGQQRRRSTAQVEDRAGAVRGTGRGIALLVRFLWLLAIVTFWWCLPESAAIGIALVRFVAFAVRLTNARGQFRVVGHLCGALPVACFLGLTLRVAGPFSE